MAGYIFVEYVKYSVLCTQANCSMNMDMSTVLLLEQSFPREQLNHYV